MEDLSLDKSHGEKLDPTDITSALRIVEQIYRRRDQFDRRQKRILSDPNGTQPLEEMEEVEEPENDTVERIVKRLLDVLDEFDKGPENTIFEN